ncbi:MULTISPECIES: RNA recognition motif domain-containing protein [Chryseobacterium]|jgi:RNA recognition motif-containing protein|uniref:RNA recognition motif. (A.k.a. RRM, RBD, or RNP domain) n=2 Tax=Chryseobacterium TaxID=59732 RepID=A0A521AY88_9FLAO|nr:MULTISPECIES: RNA-binding protein [Chryseobacterium]MBB6329901.1 RNA recognition motif-containing protein [Chryseobacterium sediminis]MDR3025252.1 RNA-binding protein [Chryseobacterium sp.]MDR6461861.1 RNA recognition motif-containing protein [Chryseobacterium sediminis]MDW9379554.1 RNA-binding protein [Chryseobacterium sp. JV558]QXU49870.1 RNA-binding protein [Chryseobacterium sp. D764]
MNIFVSNINYATKEYELHDLFAEFGDVSSAKIVTDRETGRSRGFGFVEMGDEEGQQAIEALNQKEFNGKALNVSEAKPREEKPRRSFDNNRGGGYGGGNNNRGGGYGGGNNNRGGGGGNRW